MKVERINTLFKCPLCSWYVRARLRANGCLQVSLTPKFCPAPTGGARGSPGGRSASLTFSPWSLLLQSLHVHSPHRHRMFQRYSPFRTTAVYVPHPCRASLLPPIAQDTHSKGVHLTMRAGRGQTPVLLPSVQQVKPYRAVLSTFSTAGVAKPLPSCTLYHMP